MRADFLEFANVAAIPVFGCPAYTDNNSCHFSAIVPITNESNVPMIAAFEFVADMYASNRPMIFQR